MVWKPFISAFSLDINHAIFVNLMAFGAAPAALLQSAHRIPIPKQYRVNDQYKLKKY